MIYLPTYGDQYKMSKQQQNPDEAKILSIIFKFKSFFKDKTWF
jgi:hypothetical protein